MMDEIKVAICYRGQMRMMDQALIMRERLLESMAKYEFEVRFFGHTNATESIVYGQEYPDVVNYNLRENRPVNFDQCVKNMNKMGIHAFRVFEHPHIYRMAEKVIEYWSKHQDFLRFIERNPARYHFIDYFLLNNYEKSLHILGKNKAEHDLYYTNQMYIGDFMSQYVSSGHAIQMAIDYAENHGWVPDIVINLRWDAAVEIEDLIGLYEAVNFPGEKRILTKGLISTNGVGRMDDLAFITNFDNAIEWMGDIDNRIHQLLTDWRVITAISEFDVEPVSHIFWNHFARHNLRYVNTEQFKAALMRPGVEKEYDLETAKIADIYNYCHKWNDRLNKELEEMWSEKRGKILGLDYAYKMLGIEDQE